MKYRIVQDGLGRYFTQVFNDALDKWYEFEKHKSAEEAELFINRRIELIAEEKRREELAAQIIVIKEIDG